MSAFVLVDLQDCHPAEWLVSMGLASAEIGQSAILIRGEAPTKLQSMSSALWTGVIAADGFPPLWDIATQAGKRVAWWQSAAQEAQPDSGASQVQSLDLENCDLVVFSLVRNDERGNQLAARTMMNAAGFLTGPCSAADGWGWLLAMRDGHVVYPLESVINVIDIAPTVLSLLGVVIPKTMPGHALTGLGGALASDDELTAEEIALMQTHLRGLGYLG